MTFGKRLKKARTEKNMTQKQLADLLSVKHNSISNWENDINKPDPDMIELICGVLEITPNFLLATSTEDFSPAEKLIIKKYRELDEHGRKMFDFMLQEEWERSTFYENIDEVEKYRKAQKYYDSVLDNKKRVTVEDLVAPFPDEDAPPKTLSQLADDLLNAAHAIENASEEDKRFDNDIMDDENF